MFRYPEGSRVVLKPELIHPDDTEDEVLTGTVSHNFDRSFKDKTETGTEWVTVYWDDGSPGVWMPSSDLDPCYGPLT